MSSGHSVPSADAASRVSAARADFSGTLYSDAVPTPSGYTQPLPQEGVSPEDRPRLAVSRALRLVRRAVDEGRPALRGVHMASTARASLEESFANFLKDARPGLGVGLRILGLGKPRTLNPAVQEQLFLIGREAIVNALRHSRATKIEVEVRYLHALLRVLVCDNGCGICVEAVQNASEWHWGLRRMRHWAESIGAQFRILSRRGAGTEVNIAIPIQLAMASAARRAAGG